MLGPPALATDKTDKTAMAERTPREVSSEWSRSESTLPISSEPKIIEIEAQAYEGKSPNLAFRKHKCPPHCTRRMSRSMLRHSIVEEGSSRAGAGRGLCHGISSLRSFAKVAGILDAKKTPLFRSANWQWVSAGEIGWSGTQNQPIGFQGAGD